MRTALLVMAVAAGGCHGAATEPKAQAATTTATDGAWWCGAIHGDPVVARALGHGGRLVVGAIADTHGASAEALANVARLADAFAQAHVDAVAALGDLGRTKDEIARVLEALGAAKAPVLALAGEEDETVFHAAVNEVRTKGIDVIDLVDKRILDTGEMDIVSAPGYPFSKDGCRYRAADLTALAAREGARNQPRLLLAHTPPHGDGASAPDWAIGDVNAGDRAMRALADALHPEATLFAHVDEAGGRTTPGGWVNVGAGERGQGAIVELEGGRARARVLP